MPISGQRHLRISPLNVLAFQRAWSPRNIHTPPIPCYRNYLWPSLAAFLLYFFRLPLCLISATGISLSKYLIKIISLKIYELYNNIAQSFEISDFFRVCMQKKRNWQFSTVIFRGEMKEFLIVQFTTYGRAVWRNWRRVSSCIFRMHSTLCINGMPFHHHRSIISNATATAGFSLSKTTTATLARSSSILWGHAHACVWWTMINDLVSN